jgi:hypothetical protein
MYAPEGHSERNNAPWFEAMTGMYCSILLATFPDSLMHGSQTKRDGTLCRTAT